MRRILYVKIFSMKFLAAALMAAMFPAIAQLDLSASDIAGSISDIDTEIVNISNGGYDVDSVDSYHDLQMRREYLRLEQIQNGDSYESEYDALEMGEMELME